MHGLGQACEHEMLAVQEERSSAKRRLRMAAERGGTHGQLNGGICASPCNGGSKHVTGQVLNQGDKSVEQTMCIRCRMTRLGLGMERHLFTFPSGQLLGGCTCNGSLTDQSLLPVAAT